MREKRRHRKFQLILSAKVGRFIVNTAGAVLVSAVLAACPPTTGPEIPNPPVKQNVNLAAPVLQFDNATGGLSWAPVANANSYVLTVNGQPVTDFTLVGGRYVHTLSQFGGFTAAVRAVGYETETHIYNSATSAELGGNFTEPQQGKIEAGPLGTPVLGFDNAAGIVHWAPVANALTNGYTLLINDTPASFSLINDRYEHKLQSTGGFTAKVTANGHETATHIYDDSVQATKTDTYTIVKTPVNLAQPVLSFDKDTGIISWNTVPNANNPGAAGPYTLLVNDVAASFEYKNGRYEYQLPTGGPFTAKVTANGYETDTHVYNPATSATLSDTYVKTIQPLEPIYFGPVNTGWSTAQAQNNVRLGIQGLHRQSGEISDRFGEWETQTQAQSDFAVFIQDRQTAIQNAWGSTTGIIAQDFPIVRGAKPTVSNQIDAIINEVKNIYAEGGGDADMLNTKFMAFRSVTMYIQRKHNPNVAANAESILSLLSLIDSIWGGGDVFAGKTFDQIAETLKEQLEGYLSEEDFGPYRNDIIQQIECYARFDGWTLDMMQVISSNVLNIPPSAGVIGSVSPVKKFSNFTITVPAAVAMPTKLRREVAEENGIRV